MDDQVMEAFGTLATALGHADDVIEYPAVRALYVLLEAHKREVLREAAERIRSLQHAGHDHISCLPCFMYSEAAQQIDPEATS